MWHYRAPVADTLHLMMQVLDAPASWSTMPVFDGLDADTAREVLEQAGKFAGDVLAPTNGPGDVAGCTWTPDGVSTPPGFAAAYRTFVEGGWPALACAPEAGGQGLPQLLNMVLYEMLTSANHAWMMYPGLLHGAYEVLQHHAVPELRERYLQKVVSGEWLATMNLTEPQAGSDLGLVRTKAEPVGGIAPANGTPVLISGNKIFISGGDHDLTDNIVHLVLCRLADAPPGTRGLSLAIVPKLLPNGTRNTVFCDGIEKKMGIKGSATCQMRFERAQGWLVGEPNRGLAAMFLMMNAARLQVAMQGVGHLEAATQNAWRYAAERQQTAIWLDESQQHPDIARREAATAHIAFLTPIAKALFTELGHRSADEALGVWGGYGFVHEYGIEQAARDSRIALIYEGTNEIQAIDLMPRKLLDDGGRRAAALRALLYEEVEACQGTAFGDALAEQLECWRRADEALIDGATKDSEWPLRIADDYLMAVGHALMAWAWARIARRTLDPSRTPAAGGRTATQWLDAARFGVEWLLPQAATHWTRVHRCEAALPFIT